MYVLNVCIVFVYEYSKNINIYMYVYVNVFGMYSKYVIKCFKCNYQYILKRPK